MVELKIQALRLMLRIDEVLERFEDSFTPLSLEEHVRVKKLKQIMMFAEKRYYRRSQVTASPWSLVTKLAETNLECTGGKKVPSTGVEAVTEQKAQAVAANSGWMGPYM
jgi:hypothetical protein